MVLAPKAVLALGNASLHGEAPLDRERGDVQPLVTAAGGDKRQKAKGLQPKLPGEQNRSRVTPTPSKMFALLVFVGSAGKW